MMTQPAAVVVQEPADEAIAASAELAQYLDQQVEDFAQTEDSIIGGAEALLPVEEMAIASNEPAQHGEQPDTTAPFKFDDAVLAGFRIGYRHDAAATAEKTRTAGASATQTILEMAGSIQQMKSRLNRKEFGVFVKGLLQWVGDEARKYLDIAHAFEGFDLSRLVNLEPFIILKLRSKKYAPIIERLQMHRDITPNLVQDLIKELLTKPTRKKPSEPISGWKQSRSGGGRYYNLHLHDESTGLSIEQQAEAENILPQEVIAEAVALRAQHKSSVQPDQSSAPQSERLPAMIERSLSPENSRLGEKLPISERTDAELESRLTEHEVAKASDKLFEALEPQVTALAPQQTAEYGAETTQADNHLEPEQLSDYPEPAHLDNHLGEQQESAQELSPGDLVQIHVTHPNGDKTWNRMSGYIQKLSPATGKATVLLQGDYRSKQFFLDSLKLVQEDEANLSDTLQTSAPESVQETSPTAIPQSEESSESTELPTTTLLPQDSVAPEQIEQATQPEETAAANADDCQPITPPWDTIKQLRDAESRLQEIDTSVQKLNSKLADSGSDPVVEREITPVLKKQLDLRSTKVSQIVELIDSGGLSAYYEEYQGFGRVILATKYSSNLLLQAKSWVEVMLVVGKERAQLVKAVADWTLESKLNLVQLLSVYLETEPNALGQIDWIPKKLLARALSTLSFKIRKIGGPDNLVDEPEFKYIPCTFVSLEHPGTEREQWVFKDSNYNNHPVFGRDEIGIE